MKLFIRRWSAFVLILCALALHTSQGQVEAPVIKKVEIRHVGPPAASDALIRANIRVKEGDPYTRLNVDDDVRSLYSTGYFYIIRIVVEPLENNGVNVVFAIQGKPVLSEVRIEGNKKYSVSKIRKKITSKVGEPLDEPKLFHDVQQILEMYQKAGYQKTTVKYLPPVIEQNSGRATVTFHIEEAPKVRVKDVVFVNAEAFPQKKLRKALKTRRHWMFSWLTGTGVLKEEEFDEDKERLAEFYREAGYVDFELKDVQQEYLTTNRMILKLVVDEGRQYKVGAVNFTGNTNYTSEEILKGINSLGATIKPKMTEGQTFTPKGLREDVEAVEDFYGSKGYIDTRVRPVKNPNTEKGTVDVDYKIINEAAGKSYIEKIEIKGNVRTKDNVLRRELAVHPGETFDMVRVKVSKSRLEQMDYFEKVETDVQETDVPNRKNLVIDVEEHDTAYLDFGAGFSSIESLFGQVGYREANFDLFNPPYFRGGGQKLRVNLILGLRRKDFRVTFTEPWFLGQRLAFETELFHSEADYYSDLYNETETGITLGLTKQLPYHFLTGDTITAGLNYTIENIGLNNVQTNAPVVILNEPRSQLISKVGSALTYDTRNHSLQPTRGQKTSLIAEVAGGPLGGDAEFYKLEAQTSWYFPGLAKDHIIELIGRMGVVSPYGSGNRVPLSERYFLGGVTTLRGYRYRQVGPKQLGSSYTIPAADPKNPPTVVPGVLEPIGGDSYWLGSVEYSIPIIPRLRFAVFYDIGNVYADPYDFNFSEYADNWGLGIRLNIPRLGPIRLDYGIPITHPNNTSGSGKFQFSVGFTRSY